MWVVEVTAGTVPGPSISPTGYRRVVCTRPSSRTVTVPGGCWHERSHTTPRPSRAIMGLTLEARAW